jgi:hypothetical protein
MAGLVSAGYLVSTLLCISKWNCDKLSHLNTKGNQALFPALLPSKLLAVETSLVFWELSLVYLHLLLL